MVVYAFFDCDWIRFEGFQFGLRFVYVDGDGAIGCR